MTVAVLSRCTAGRRFGWIGLGALALSVLAAPAHAQLAVYDAVAYAKLIEQASTALQQLSQLKAQSDQARQLFASLNTGSGVSTLASQLSSPQLRELIPASAALNAAPTDNFSGLGELGVKAAAVREAARVYTPTTSDQRTQDQETAARRAALDQAIGQAVVDTGADRLHGLQSLSSSIDDAANARAVLDMQARLSAEAAMVANDQLRMQGLAMAQAAERRLAEQTERERVAAARDARLALYRRGFQ